MPVLLLQEMIPEASRVKFADVKGCPESVAEVRPCISVCFYLTV